MSTTKAVKDPPSGDTQQEDRGEDRVCIEWRGEYRAVGRANNLGLQDCPDIPRFLGIALAPPVVCLGLFRSPTGAFVSQSILGVWHVGMCWWIDGEGTSINYDHYYEPGSVSYERPPGVEHGGEFGRFSENTEMIMELWDQHTEAKWNDNGYVLTTRNCWSFTLDMFNFCGEKGGEAAVGDIAGWEGAGVLSSLTERGKNSLPPPSRNTMDGNNVTSQLSVTLFPSAVSTTSLFRSGRWTSSHATSYQQRKIEILPPPSGRRRNTRFSSP